MPNPRGGGGRHRKSVFDTKTRKLWRVIIAQTIFVLCVGTIFVGGYLMVWYLISDDKPTLLQVAPQKDFTPVNPSVPSSLMNINKDCPDFFDQEDAQKYFVAQGGPKSDPDDLDLDNDGLACENYDYSQSDPPVPPETEDIQSPQFYGTDTSKVNAK
jgi:hypothetical protein